MAESEFRKRERLMKIKHYFELLKRARTYFETEPDKSRDDEALQKVETIYAELEKLGVGKPFSTGVFLFDPKMDDILVKQFKENDGRVK